MKKIGIVTILILILLFICIILKNTILLENYQKPSNIYIKESINNKQSTTKPKEEILLKRIYSKLNYTIDYNPSIFNYIEGDIDKLEYIDNTSCYLTIDKDINVNKYCEDENISRYIDELISTIRVN